VLAVAARRVEAGRVDVEPRERLEQVQAFGLGLARGLEDLREDGAINVLALRLGPRGAVRLQRPQDLGFINGRPTTTRALCDSILRNRCGVPRMVLKSAARKFEKASI
jgi:hypothetical protein